LLRARRGPIVLISERRRSQEAGVRQKDTGRHKEMRPAKRIWAAIPLGLAVLWLAVLPAAADGKKLQVIQDQAVIRLEPTDQSLAVETLGRGSILSLASPIKTRVNWFYVYFTSLQSGNTRAGYINESCVRKLFPTLKIIQITSGDEILNPAEIELDPNYQPNLTWGTTKTEIIRSEGRPQREEVTQGFEVLVYRREIMKKQCQLEYILDGNRLVSARLALLENYADKNRYIEDYNKICEFLTAKVGTPRADRTVWQDRSYERQNDCWGIALGQGHVEFSSEWVFRDTELRLLLAGANNHVNFSAVLNDVKSRKPTS
jgi:hypothetical protein